MAINEDNTDAQVASLWCMHVAGPGDVHPAPDFWTALAWATELNALIAKRAINGKWADDDNWPLTQATVKLWPYTAEEYGWRLAKELADRKAHEERRAALAAVNDDPSTTVEAARELIRTGLESFVDDPADSPFQRGYLEALYVIGREGLGMKFGKATVAEPKHPAAQPHAVT